MISTSIAVYTDLWMHCSTFCTVCEKHCKYSHYASSPCRTELEQLNQSRIMFQFHLLIF